MKTRILTLITVLGLVFVLSNSSKAEAVKRSASTVLSTISNFSKIEVRGNVELYVTSGSANQVKVYNNYYSENALVQNENGVLRVTSYKPEKLVVWVTVTDLRSVALFDNSEIKSFGKLSALDLAVNLHDNSLANLNMDAFSANITINDQAKANLTGNADECNITYNQTATVNSSKFAANHINRNVIPVSYVTKNMKQQYAGL